MSASRRGRKENRQQGAEDPGLAQTVDQLMLTPSSLSARSKVVQNEKETFPRERLSSIIIYKVWGFLPSCNMRAKFVLAFDDLESTVSRLKGDGVNFKNEIVEGPGGK